MRNRLLLPDGIHFFKRYQVRGVSMVRHITLSQSWIRPDRVLSFTIFNALYQNDKPSHFSHFAITILNFVLEVVYFEDEPFDLVPIDPQEANQSV